MLIYDRHIEKRLLGLRISFFILVTAFVLAFINHNEKPVYFISVVLFSLSFISIKKFIVSKDSFQISKFYFFGLIKRTWIFKKSDNIKVSTFGTDFGEEGDFPFVDSGDSAPLSIISFFFIVARPKITMNEFKVEKFDETNWLISSVRILLNKDEFNYLNSFIRQQNNL